MTDTTHRDNPSTISGTHRTNAALQPGSEPPVSAPEPVKRALVTAQEPYPDDLAERERKHVATRRAAAGANGSTATAGVAISGGGIRSATFALGIFQSLARAKLLPHIDYLSTVSGGGYFGSFLGALFSRPETKSIRDVDAVLTNRSSKELRHLRENGRYLAPGGTADLVLAAGVLIRNWLAVHVVLGSFMLAAFLLAEAALLGVFWAHPATSDALLSPDGRSGFETGLIAQYVWLSPWFVVPAGALLFAAVPYGWAYFSLERRLPRWWPTAQREVDIVWQALPQVIVAVSALFVSNSGHPWLAAVLIWIAMLSFSIATTAPAERDNVLWIPFIAGVVLAIAAHVTHVDWANLPEGWWQHPTQFASPALRVALPACIALLGVLTIGRPAQLRELPLAADTRARHRVSVSLSHVFWAIGLTTAFAVVDTLGRSLYAAVTTDWPIVFGVSGGALGLLSLLATYARDIAIRFTAKQGDKAPPLRLSLLVWIASAVLALSFLTSASFAAQVVAWEGEAPTRAPVASTQTAATSRATLVTPTDKTSPKVELVFELPAATQTPAPLQQDTAAAPAAAEGQKITVGGAARNCAWGCLIAAVAAMLLGSSRIFLNRSTQLPLYSARLTRAYLGASNPNRYPKATSRVDAAPVAATRVIDGDDIPAEDYWDWPRPKADDSCNKPAWSIGGPLHIINVTINETVDGRSQTQQLDRKGLGLAVGPCALSAGVKHHLLPGPRPVVRQTAEDHVVFDFDKSAEKDSLPVERLSLGQWMGISGAAFSTGLGSRTHTGMSFLAGIMNVRLGHWWRPGIDWKPSASRAFGALFWVQSYLAKELFALFPGTRNALWYLSDGGHFENMGAYELIRRRLPLIVVIDGEEDGDADFEGLGNLVRKARLDFGAEITFLDDPWTALAEHRPKTSKEALEVPLGPFEHLRRGKWTQEGNTVPPTFSFEPDAHGHSLARAALAQVRYAEPKYPGDVPEQGLLLYIKPTVRPDMPRDLAHYAREHAAFPHEPTIDQFFDEAQWESYRLLGEMTGKELFPENHAADDAVLCRLLLGEHPWLLAEQARRERRRAVQRPPAAPAQAAL